MSEVISVTAYNSLWPKMFQDEYTLLKEALGVLCIDIQHIGSTAVPGLCAKPKIDIIAVVTDLYMITQCLESAGYISGGELNIPFRFYFKKRGGMPEVNLHVYEEGNAEIQLNLLFRDYLRTHPKMLSRYADLKMSLVSQELMHLKNGERFSGYNLGKDQFIKEVLDAAGFNGLCMRLCSHHDEWELAQRHSELLKRDELHFVFYKGTKLIGYAHVKELKKQYCVMPLIHMDNEYTIHLRYFQEKVSSWLNTQGLRLVTMAVIKHGSDLYKKAVDLRQKILRTPLGLKLSIEELELESDDIHIIALLGDTVLATCALVINNQDRVKMCRVAVDSSLQGSGLGSEMLRYTEAYALKMGFDRIYCHARETALEFYKRNHYTIEGDLFTEIGIPHRKMFRELT